ncbi:MULTISPECIES: hypothetical protein [Rhodanobacter]|uniref:hypothetical protein n=1 Tax=Rhodanobacter TaxID=75309 RepID=UPI000AF17342|nr:MULTISPECIES: hypothetical protein [Rhodanobacter]UJJ50585.1 hypothetical protein LRK52_15310 [Rhodanobacter denitrificans]UJM91091.1 hypothetical protein LRK24_04045 [Rhodanobacter denitrificans]UJM93301.1 hypothetical protein LRK32_15220 [Rhodanobacter denitrificans]UJM96833.1 hypothetical protein LRK44_15230 [Rhodanobacter denitrificans]UJN20339.1 hypothetical protein LRK54_11410 [Rhodanobacter denitrificans]
MGKTIFFTGLFALSILPLSANASVTATVCNACGPADLRQEALDEGNGDHYLYDFVNQKITHYNISGLTPRLTSTGMTLTATSTYITIVPIDSATQSVFNAVQNFYVSNHDSVYATAKEQVSVSINQTQFGLNARHSRLTAMSGTRPMTAFDMVQVPVYRQMAIDTQTSFSHLDAYPNVVRAAAGTVLNVVNVVPFVKVPIIMDITLEFPDHSTSVIRYNFNEQKFEYIEGSSKDGVGNPIPETPQEVSGGGSKTYIFPAGPNGAAAGSAQLTNLERMGIRTPVAIYHSGWTLACSNVSNELPRCEAWPL